MITQKDVGHRVMDGAGRIGILRAVDPEWEDPAELPDERTKRPTAFLWPEGGGREWTASPLSVKRV